MDEQAGCALSEGEIKVMDIAEKRMTYLNSDAGREIVPRSHHDRIF
jgi:hypothetical protein